MKVVLSGFAGVGKSTIIEYIKKNHSSIFISPESAREVNYTKDFFKIEDLNSEFFQKSVMDNEIMKIVLSHLNSINNIVYDRCLIDNLAFAEIFYGKDRVNYEKVVDFVNYIREEYSVNNLYDLIVFIKSTHNYDFVKKNILNDSFRRATTAETPEEFIKKSIYWENLYFDILKRVPHITANCIILDHYSENSNYEKNLEMIIKEYLS